MVVKLIDSNIAMHQALSDRKENLVIIWQEIDQGNKLYKKAFDQSGNNLDDKQLIKEGAYSFKSKMISESKYLVIWKMDNPDDRGFRIGGSIYDITTDYSQEIIVKKSIQFAEGYYSIVSNNSYCLINWEDSVNYQYSLYSQAFGHDGRAITEAILISQGDSVRKESAGVMISENEFMIAWSAYSDYRYNLSFKRYNIDKGLSDVAFFEQGMSDITKSIDMQQLASEDYVVSWIEDGQLWSKRGQKEEVKVKIDGDEGGQSQSKIVNGVNDEIMVIWQKGEQDIKIGRYDSGINQFTRISEVFNNQDKLLDWQFSVIDDGYIVTWIEDNNGLYGIKLNYKLEDVNFSFKPIANNFVQEIGKDSKLNFYDNVSDWETTRELLKIQIVKMPIKGEILRDGGILSNWQEAQPINDLSYRSYQENCRDIFGDLIEYLVVDGDEYKSNIARLEIAGQSFDCQPVSANMILSVDNGSSNISFDYLYSISAIYDQSVYPNQNKSLGIKLIDISNVNGYLKLANGELAQQGMVYGVNDIAYLAKEENCQEDYYGYLTFVAIDELAQESESALVGINGSKFNCYPKAEEFEIHFVEEQSINFAEYVSDYESGKGDLRIKIINKDSLVDGIFRFGNTEVEVGELYGLNNFSLSQKESCSGQDNYFSYTVIDIDGGQSSSKTVTVKNLCQVANKEEQCITDEERGWNILDHAIEIGVSGLVGSFLGWLLSYFINLCTKSYRMDISREIPEEVKVDTSNKPREEELLKEKEEINDKYVIMHTEMEENNYNPIESNNSGLINGYEQSYQEHGLSLAQADQLLGLTVNKIKLATGLKLRLYKIGDSFIDKLIEKEPENGYSIIPYTLPRGDRKHLVTYVHYQDGIQDNSDFTIIDTLSSEINQTSSKTSIDSSGVLGLFVTEAQHYDNCCQMTSYNLEKLFGVADLNFNEWNHTKFLNQVAKGDVLYKMIVDVKGFGIKGLAQHKELEAMRELVSKHDVRVDIKDEASFKKAYHEIALKTHPDKNHYSDIEDFVAATQYKKQLEQFNLKDSLEYWVQANFQVMFLGFKVIDIGVDLIRLSIGDNERMLRKTSYDIIQLTDWMIRTKWGLAVKLAEDIYNQESVTDLMVDATLISGTLLGIDTIAYIGIENLISSYYSDNIYQVGMVAIGVVGSICYPWATAALTIASLTMINMIELSQELWRYHAQEESAMITISTETLDEAMANTNWDNIEYNLYYE